MDTVFVVLDINLKVMDDTGIMGTYSSLEAAFNAAYSNVKQKEGKNILVHNYTIEGETTTTDRLSNNNSLGSSYGISYKSYYGGYPCCRMIVPQTVK